MSQQGVKTYKHGTPSFMPIADIDSEPTGSENLQMWHEVDWPGQLEHPSYNKYVRKEADTQAEFTLPS